MKMRIRYRILALAAAASCRAAPKESHCDMNLPEAEKVTVQIKTKALTGSVVEGDHRKCVSCSFRMRH